MATAAAARNVKDMVFEWEGRDKNGKIVRGELRAGGEAQVSANLRRQGILLTKVKKRPPLVRRFLSLVSRMPWRRRLALTWASPPARISPRTILPFLSRPSLSKTSSLTFLAADAVAMDAPAWA